MPLHYEYQDKQTDRFWPEWLQMLSGQVPTQRVPEPLPPTPERKPAFQQWLEIQKRKPVPRAVMSLFGGGGQVPTQTAPQKAPLGTYVTPQAGAPFHLPPLTYNEAPPTVAPLAEQPLEIGQIPVIPREAKLEQPTTPRYAHPALLAMPPTPERKPPVPLLADAAIPPKYEGIKTTIKEDEGFRLNPYKLTYGPEGKKIKEKFQTGGYGHKILSGETEPQGGYTKEYWDETFNSDFDTSLKAANKIIPEENLDPIAFGILTEMVYQMGEGRVKGFKNAIKHLKAQDYDQAADQLLFNYNDKGEVTGKTGWHTQTPERANRAADRLRNIERR